MQPHPARMLVEVVHTPEFNRLSRWVLGLLRSYFRIELSGVENIPTQGSAIITPNHSGFAGTDAVMLTHLIKRHTRRRARILAHRAFFDFSGHIKDVAESFGLRRASLSAGVEILKARHLMMIFPEGEAGNFKSTLKRYRLQRFRTGFVRMAVQAKAPIVPCLIIGAEESHLNLGNLDLSAIAKGMRIPVPASLVPLPAKWRIHFLPAIQPEAYGDVSHEDDAAMEQLARDIQAKMQRALNNELRKRPYIFFRETRKLWNFVRRPLTTTDGGGRPHPRASGRRSPRRYSSTESA